jgi:hypothetical protein
MVILLISFIGCICSQIFYFIDLCNDSAWLERLRQKQAIIEVSGVPSWVNEEKKSLTILINSINNKKIKYSRLILKRVSRKKIEEIYLCKENPECVINLKLQRFRVIKKWGGLRLYARSVRETYFATEEQNKARIYFFYHIYNMLNKIKDVRIRSFMKDFTLAIQDKFSPEIETRFRLLGISHLLVISGLHLVLLYWAFFF